jgi:D-psicose/D-tagatose/L-ribulose 3-epimerase
MKLGLIENAWFGSSVGRVKGIEIAEELGFDTYDVFPIDLTPTLKRQMKAALRRSGLEVPTFIVFGYSLTDFNAEVRRFALKWLKRQMDLGAYFGGRNMVLVLGEYILEKVELKPEVQWRWALEGVRDLADYARSQGMGVALEFPAHKFSMVNNVDSMSRFLRDVRHSSVNSNVDVSHLYLMGDPPEAVSRLKGRIAHVHFSDCNGVVHGDLPPGRGVVPLRDYLAALRDNGYRGPVSLELEWSPEPERIREWVDEAYRATASMMRDLNVRA